MTLALYGKSRKRRGSLLLAALLAILVATIGGVSIITSAFAHTAAVSGSAACQADGTYRITWQLQNDWNTAAALSAVSLTASSTWEGGAPTSIPAAVVGVELTKYSTAPGSTSGNITLSFTATWPPDPNTVVHSYTAAVSLSGDCARTIRIIKTVTGTGADTSKTFAYTVSPSSAANGNVTGAASVDKTVSSAAQTIKETESLSGVWAFGSYTTRSGLKTNCSSGSTPVTTQATGVVVPAGGDYTVCITNNYTEPSGFINISTGACTANVAGSWQFHLLAPNDAQSGQTLTLKYHYDGELPSAHTVTQAENGSNPTKADWLVDILFNGHSTITIDYAAATGGLTWNGIQGQPNDVASSTACTQPTGTVIVKKVKDTSAGVPIADLTPFGGTVGGVNWGTILFGGTTSPLTVAAGNQAFAETVTANAWTLVGFTTTADGTNNTVCSTDKAAYTASTVPVVAGHTTVVCVMNTKQADAVSTTTVTKTAPADSYALGAPFSWTITWTVAGANTGADQSYSDILPSDFEFQATPLGAEVDTGNKLSCTAASGHVNCTLLSGATVGVYSQVVNVKVKAAATCHPVTNYVKKGADTAQGDTVASDEVTITGCPTTGTIVVKKIVSGTASNSTDPFVGTVNSQTNDLVVGNYSDLSGGTNKSYPLAPGTYYTVETGLNGYTLLGYAAANADGTCPAAMTSTTAKDVTQTIAVGQTKVLCVYNKKDTPKGKIQVHKYIWDPTKGPNGGWKPNVSQGNGGVDFTFYVDGNGTHFEDITQGDPGAGLSLVSGTYTLHEDDPSSLGYDFVAFYNAPGNGTQCLNDQQGAPSSPTDLNDGTGLNSVSVIVDAPSDTHVCAYNKLKEAHIIIKKVYINHGGTNVAPKVFIGGDEVVIDANNAVDAGPHHVSETPPAGWKNTKIEFSESCGAEQVAALLAEDTQLLIAFEALGGTVGDDVDVAPGDTCTVTFTNELKVGKIIVVKVNEGGVQSDLFTAHIDGGTGFGFSAVSPSAEQTVAAGNHAVSEDGKTGYTAVGWGLGTWDDEEEEASCNQIRTTPDSTYPIDAASVSVSDGGVTVVCFYNNGYGHIKVVKIDGTTGLPGRPAQWNFKVEGPNTFLNTNSIALNTGGNYTIDNVPMGNGYTAAETNGNTSACPDPNEDGAWRTQALNGAQNITAAGQTITFTFVNNPCDIILGTGTLVIHKYNDLNGNHVLDAGETGLNHWKINVKGPQFPTGQDFFTDASGQIVIAGLTDGAYTLTEENQAGYVVIGVVNGNATFSSGSSVGSGTVAHGQTTTVNFFNQPRVSVKVTKTEINGGISSPGQGWTMTISGCGYTDSHPTAGADGSYTWTNLAPCTYTVTENTVSKAGYVANGPTFQTVAATGVGQTYTVAFTNVKFSGCAIECTTVIVTPTPTPPTPVITEVTKGEKTPGPTQPPVTEVVKGEKTAASTPIAPSTGSGLFGGNGGSMNILLALMGLLAVSGGLATLAFSRRK